MPDPLRIGLVNSAPGWGGGERVFQELAEGFLEAGHSVCFATRPATPMLAGAPAGATLAPLPFAGDLDAYTVFRLYRLFRRFRPDAVFGNSGRDCWLAGFGALPLRMPVWQVKAVVKRRHGARSRFLYRRMLAGVVCVSEAVRRTFAGVDLPAERLTVIPNGIRVRRPAEEEVAAARRRLGATPGVFTAVYCGRLSREKGADLLPRIAAEARALGVPLQLAVVGDGELRDQLERDLSGLGERVCFTGFVADPLPCIAAAQAALIPSRSEGFGLAAVEALAVGTPVIAADTGGLAEILSEGVTGLLVPPGGAAGFAAALARLQREPDLVGRLRASGLKRAAELSREAMISRYADLVRRVGGRGV